MACKHNWVFIEDWEGDTSLPGGTHDLTYYLCTECGEESQEEPLDFIDDREPDIDDFDPQDFNKEADYWGRDHG